MSGINQFQVVTNRMLDDARVRLGFNDHQLSGLEKHIIQAATIHNAFFQGVEKIRADRDVSTEGKIKRIEGLKLNSLEQVKAFKASCDKTEVIGTSIDRRKKTVDQIRKSNQPGNEVLSYLQAQELRQHYKQVLSEYRAKEGAAQLTNSEKLAGDPLSAAVVKAAAAYSTDPRDAAANAKHELVLSALLDGPYDLIDPGLKQRIQEGLEENLDPVNSDHLRTAVGYDQLLKRFGQSVEQIIQGA